MDLAIGVSNPRAEALKKLSLPVPQLIVVRALVDTGASCTCVDPAILKQLNLTPTGSVPVHSPTTGQNPVAQDQYDVSLTLMHAKLSLTIPSLPVIQSELAIQGIHALIGRDILKDCLLVYDGQLGVFTLAF